MVESAFEQCFHVLKYFCDLKRYFTHIMHHIYYEIGNLNKFHNKSDNTWKVLKLTHFYFQKSKDKNIISDLESSKINIEKKANTVSGTSPLQQGCQITSRAPSGSLICI